MDCLRWLHGRTLVVYIAVVDDIAGDDGTAGACYEVTADDDADSLWGWL